MKVKITMGKMIKFILIPETATEESLLKDAAKKTDLTSHLITQSTVMIDEVIPDGSLIICENGKEENV
jgi:hypothetical protein